MWSKISTDKKDKDKDNRYLPDMSDISAVWAAGGIRPPLQVIKILVILRKLLVHHRDWGPGEDRLLVQVNIYDLCSLITPLSDVVTGWYEDVACDDVVMLKCI